MAEDKVTVWIAKLDTDPNDTLNVNGTDIDSINTQKTDNGFKELTDLPVNLPTILHNGVTLNYVEGNFEAGKSYTATHHEGYLSFENGGYGISYK